MQRTFILLILLSAIFSPANLFAFISDDFHYDGRYPNDSELYNLALEKGLIKADLHDKNEIERIKQNTFLLWIIYDRDEKKEMVNFLKKAFAEEGAVVRKTASFYVNQINIRIYHTLQENKSEYLEIIDLGILFKSLAIMEGDFDDGTNKIEQFKIWYGENGYEQLKENYPEKLEKLSGIAE